ncbi:MAG: RIP metalloprotease RseP [Gammaproteobacteria bacterium]|nr:RIP metalloprotease RseP [Gammaproteobacteria bacterium]
MIDIFGSIWWLLVTLGLLITFHEFGHFWVARRMGVRVLRFSIGFGKPLWSHRGRDGTEYVVAAFPLGGYVKMLDEREYEVPEEERDEAFNNKPLGARIAIVAAGPAFNLVFAVLAFWLMFLVGIPEVRPLVGSTSGMAAEAGIERGDAISAIDGRDTRTWTHTLLGLITPALDREDVIVTVEDADGIRSEHVLPLSRLGDSFSEDQVLEAVGIEPWRLVMPATVGAVNAGSPADLAGIRAGDTITHIAAEPVQGWQWIGPLVQEHGAAGQPLAVTIERDGYGMETEVRPARQKDGWFSSKLIVGVSNADLPAEEMVMWERAAIMLQFGPLEAVPTAIKETWRLTGSTLALLGRMVTGSASVKNLSGPISIAQFASQSAAAGFSQFLFFLGAISLSLGILNLLPIPVLDGGHLLYYLIEWVKGSPVSEQAQVAGQYFGLIALAGLMSLAFINDILRLVG